MEELTLDYIAGAWRFGSSEYTLPDGQSTVLNTRGGETHTLLEWTSVEEVLCRFSMSFPEIALRRRVPAVAERYFHFCAWFPKCIRSDCRIFRHTSRSFAISMLCPFLEAYHDVVKGDGMVATQRP